MDRSVASAPSRVGAGESLSQRRHYIQERRSRMGSPTPGPRLAERYSPISNRAPSSPTTTKYGIADSPPPQPFPFCTDTSFADEAHPKAVPTRTESLADTDLPTKIPNSDYGFRAIQSPPITKENFSPSSNRSSPIDPISPLSNQSSNIAMDSVEVWMEEDHDPQSQHSKVAVSPRAQYGMQTNQRRTLTTAVQSPESELSTSSSRQKEEQAWIKHNAPPSESMPLTSVAPWSRESLRGKTLPPVTQSPTSTVSKEAAETQEQQPPWMKDRMKLTTPGASNMPLASAAPWSRDSHLGSSGRALKLFQLPPRRLKPHQELWRIVRKMKTTTRNRLYLRHGPGEKQPRSSLVLMIRAPLGDHQNSGPQWPNHRRHRRETVSKVHSGHHRSCNPFPA
jgi:hypothetical protein